MPAGRGLPRAVDVALAAAALVVLAPVLAGVAVAVRLTSPGPVLYRQQRLGRHGEPFRILKFRTMVVCDGRTRQITVGADPRITPVGRWLRRHKLDELPQLVNVLRGEMALVGPRPEVPELVRLDLPEQRVVLSCRPGLTDPASLAFTDEAALLAAAPQPDVAYHCEVLPAKLRLSAAYLEHRTAVSDLGVLLRTVAHVLRD